MKEDKISQKYNQEFKDFEYEVPANSWENVKEKLDGGSKKPVAWSFYSISGLAASFLFYFSVQIADHFSSNKLNSSKEIITNQVEPEENSNLLSDNFEPQFDNTKSSINQQPIPHQSIDKIEMNLTTQKTVILNKNRFVIDRLINNEKLTRLPSLYPSLIPFEKIEPKKKKKRFKLKIKSLQIGTSNQTNNRNRNEIMLSDQSNSTSDYSQSHQLNISSATYYKSFSESPNGTIDQSNSSFIEFNNTRNYGGKVSFHLNDDFFVSAGISHTKTKTTEYFEEYGEENQRQLTFRYIGIPLGIGYEIINKKRFNQFIQLSFSPEKSGNILAINYLPNGLKMSENLSYNGFQNGFHLESGANFQIHKKWSFALTGKLSNYSLSKKHILNSRNQKAVLAQINFGLNYQLK